MGAWGCEIRESDATLDWECRWDKILKDASIATGAAIAADIEANHCDAEDKALGYLMLGQLVLENGISITNSLKTEIMRAAKYEVDSGRINDWNEPSVRMGVFTRFTDAIFEVEPSDG